MNSNFGECFNKLVSVIVPIYNTKKYLNRCVDSIMKQTYSKIEIILIDDGSTDGSEKICDDLKTKDERIFVIHKPNGGLSSARNAALEIIKGDFIVFIDSDDWIYPQMIEKMYSAVVNNCADLAICGMGTEQNGKITSYPIASPKFVLTNSELMRDYMSTNNVRTIVCNKLYKRCLFNNIRFPIGKIHEDVFIVHQLLGQCNLAVYVPDCLYVQLIRIGSITQSNFSKNDLSLLEADQLIIEYYFKNYPNLIDLVAYRKVNDIANLMCRIIKDFTIIRNRKYFLNLNRMLHYENKKAMKIAPFGEYLSRQARLATKHLVLFMLFCCYLGIRHRLGFWFRTIYYLI